MWRPPLGRAGNSRRACGRSATKPWLRRGRATDEAAGSIENRARLGRAGPAVSGARLDQRLSPHLLSAGRVPLPPSADLLVLRGRSDRSLRPVGRRLDDLGAAVPLSPLGNIRPRFRPGLAARRPTLVPAVA